MFEKGDSSNKQKKMDAPFSSFYGKIWDGFCLNTGKRFSQKFILNLTERAQVLLKTGTTDF